MGRWDAILEPLESLGGSTTETVDQNGTSQPWTNCSDSVWARGFSVREKIWKVFLSKMTQIGSIRRKIHSGRESAIFRDDWSSIKEVMVDFWSNFDDFSTIFDDFWWFLTLFTGIFIWNFRQSFNFMGVVGGWGEVEKNENHQKTLKTHQNYHRNTYG